LLEHRGPDGDGFHFEAGVGIAHRRLSIIDLEGGKQPIYNEDGTPSSHMMVDPQRFGGCVTYYRRYTTVALLALQAGEDDDGNTASGHTGRGARQQRRGAQPRDGNGRKKVVEAVPRESMTVETRGGKSGDLKVWKIAGPSGAYATTIDADLGEKLDLAFDSGEVVQLTLEKNGRFTDVVDVQAAPGQAGEQQGMLNDVDPIPETPF